MAVLTSDKAVVEAVWKMNDQASGPMKKLGNEARLLGLSMSRLRESNLFALAGSAALATVAAAGIAKVGKSMVDENNQLEQMKLGMGALLYQAQELGDVRKQYDDINGALAESDKIYERLYIHSLKAIGTVDDYTQAWRAVHSAVRKAGGSLEDVEYIAKQIVPFAKFYNIRPDVAALDVQQLLMGRMRTVDMLPRFLGFTSDSINEKTRQNPKPTLDLLMSRLATGTAGLKAQEHTFAAKWDTLKGNLQMLQRVGGKSLFDQVKSDLDSINNDFLTNQKQVFDYARLTGDEIRGMYIGLKDAAVWAVKHFSEIKSIAEFLLRTWLTMKVAGMFGNVFKEFGILKGKFKEWGGFARVTSQGVEGLADSVFTLGNAATAAAASVIAAIQGIRAVSAEVEEIRTFEATNKELTGASQVLGLLSAAEKAGIAITDEDMLYVDTEAKKRTEAWWEDRWYHPWKTLQTGLFYDLPAEGVKIFTNDWQRARQEDVYERNRANALAEILNERRKSHFKFDENFKPDEEIGKIDVKNDFRGSHIQITVDSRHSDPNRVAATVVNELSRMAKLRTVSAARLPASRGSMGRSA